MAEAERTIETIAGIPVEAITDPYGLRALKEYEREIEFLKEFNTFALGPSEKEAITRDEEQEIFGKKFVQATPISFIFWELIGIPLEYFVGSKRPGLVGKARAEEYIRKAWEEGFKEGYYSRDARDLESYVKKLTEEGKKEKEGEEEEGMHIIDYVKLCKTLGAVPFKAEVDPKKLRVYITEINEEELEKALKKMRKGREYIPPSILNKEELYEGRIDTY